jgi:hypothetical protein
MKPSSTLVLFDREQLLAYIEFLRIELIKIGLKHGLSSDKTLNASQELDYFIYEYQKVTIN